MKTSASFRTLDERMSGYDPQIAAVIRRVLYEEQRKLALKNPRDIVTLIERIIDESASSNDDPEGQA